MICCPSREVLPSVRGWHGSLVAFVIVLITRAAGGVSPLPTDQVEFFEKQIRPVLVERCYECHNSVNKKKGGLALDWKDALRSGGDSGPAVVPGKPQESPLIRAIRHQDSNLKMPKAGPKLSEEVAAAFEKWVAMGAPDPRDHAPSADELTKSTSWEAIRDRRMQWWSFQPIAHPTAPTVQNTQWSDHPVDRFILAKMEEAGLRPTADADRRTLIRRVTFALTGLPPSPAEIDAFLQDTSLSAYEKVVDRLLASPRFGEQWARHWMDLIRYSETHGSEGDPPIPYAWRYRDYLIRALNADIPYDRLVRENIAGDLLPDPRIDPATGANESALGIAHYRMVQHGYVPTDALDEQVTFTDNQIDVISKAFLAVTVSCARCHDHKFDPISQADFYALYGIMASARPATITVDIPGRNAEQRSKMLALKAKIRDRLADAWLKAADELPSKLLASPLPAPPGSPRPARKPTAAPAPISGWQAAIDDTAAIGARSPLYAWVQMRKSMGNTMRQEWRQLAAQTEPNPAATNLLQWNFACGDYRKWFHHGTGLASTASPAGEFSVLPAGDRILADLYPAGACSNCVSSRDSAVLTSPRFKIEIDEIFVRMAAGGGARFRIVVENYPRDGLIYPTLTPLPDEPLWYSINTRYWKGDWGYLEIATAADLPVGAQIPADRSWFGVTQIVGRSSSERPPLEPWCRLPAMTAANAPGDIRQLADRYGNALRAAVEAWRHGTMTDEQANFVDYLIRRDLLPDTLALPEVAPLVSEYRALEVALPAPIRAAGVTEAAGFDQCLLVHGNPRQQGPAVPRRFIEALDPAPYHVPNSGRLQLADSILSAKNPLSARVIANRLWHYVFGQGIVPTVDNFGRLGQPPSHPELLDYLATRMISDHWSLKHAIRLLVTSRTYQMSSDPSSDALERDPTNVLLSHFRVRRLEAESIRDSLLLVSNSLAPDMYGEPVEGNSTRRSVYVRVQRGRLDPFLAAFDAPQPFTTRGGRDVTNVPAQSLTLLNDPFVIEQAWRWVIGLSHAPGPQNTDARITSMFVTALGREPAPAERDEVLAYLNSAALSYDLHDPLLRDSRPWQDLAQAMFNLKEFIYIR